MVFSVVLKKIIIENHNIKKYLGYVGHKYNGSCK